MTQLLSNKKIFTSGGLNLITGSAGMGKTALAFSLVERYNLKPLYIGLNEVNTEAKIERIKKKYGVKEVKFLNTMSVNRLIDFILENLNKNKESVIIIDNFESLSIKSSRFLSKTSKRLNKKVRRLKQLAHALGLSIIIVGQGSKKLYKTSLLKYSGFLKFESAFDHILVPYRWEYFGDDNLYGLKDNGAVILLANSERQVLYFSSIFNPTRFVFELTDQRIDFEQRFIFEEN